MQTKREKNVHSCKNVKIMQNRDFLAGLLTPLSLWGTCEADACGRHHFVCKYAHAEQHVMLSTNISGPFHTNSKRPDGMS